MWLVLTAIVMVNHVSHCLVVQRQLQLQLLQLLSTIVPTTTTSGVEILEIQRSDFSTYPEAKTWFDIYFPHYGDVARLDGDNDGEPCESLPGGLKVYLAGVFFVIASLDYGYKWKSHSGEWSKYLVEFFKVFKEEGFLHERSHQRDYNAFP